MLSIKTEQLVFVYDTIGDLLFFFFLL